MRLIPFALLCLVLTPAASQNPLAAMGHSIGSSISGWEIGP